MSSAVTGAAVLAERQGAHVRLVRDAAWLRFRRPDLTTVLADHALSVAAALDERDLWLAAAGWMMNGRAAIGDGRDAASDVLERLARWADEPSGDPLHAGAAARRVRVELAAAAAGVDEQMTARALLAPCVDDADPELRADALTVLARCAMEDAHGDVGQLLDGARRAWSETESDHAKVGTAVIALLGAVADRRHGRPGQAADRAVEGLTSLGWCRVTPGGPTPSGHLAAALATEWITALLDADRGDDAREAAATLTARLAEPSRASRQLARLRLTVVRAAVGASRSDAAVAEMERAAQDAADSDAPDLEAVCRVAVGELHESAGRFEAALTSFQLAAAAERRDMSRSHRLRNRLAGLRVTSEQRPERPGPRAARPASASAPALPERATAPPRVVDDASPATVTPEEAAPSVTDVLPRPGARAVADSGDRPQASWEGPDTVPAAMGTGTMRGGARAAAKNGSAPLGEAPLREQHKAGWWVDDVASGGRSAARSDRRRKPTPGGAVNGRRSRAADVPVPEGLPPIGPSRTPAGPSRGEPARGAPRRTPGAVRGAPAPPATTDGGTYRPPESGRRMERVEDATRGPAERPAVGRTGPGGNRGRAVSAVSDGRRPADRAAVGSSIVTPSIGMPVARTGSGSVAPAATPPTGVPAAASPASSAPPPPVRPPSVPSRSAVSVPPSTASPVDGPPVEATTAAHAVASWPAPDPCTTGDRRGSAAPGRRPAPGRPDGGTRSMWGPGGGVPAAPPQAAGEWSGDRDSTPAAGIPTAADVAGWSNPWEDRLAEILADLDRVLGRVATGTPRTGGASETGSDRDGSGASADTVHRDGGVAIGGPDVPVDASPLAEGSVAVLDLAVEGRRLSRRSAADAVRIVRFRLAGRLPPGCRLRDDEPDAVSVVLPDWELGAAAEWLHRVLPSLAEGLLVGRATTEVQLRAAVHDAQGRAGAQLLHRLDRPVPRGPAAGRAGEVAPSLPPEESGPIRRDAAGSAGPSHRVDAAATIGPFSAVADAVEPVPDAVEPSTDAVEPAPDAKQTDGERSGPAVHADDGPTGAAVEQAAPAQADGERTRDGAPADVVGGPTDGAAAETVTHVAPGEPDRHPAGAPPAGTTGPLSTVADPDTSSGEARPTAHNRHEATSGGHLFRPDGQEVRPGSGGRRYRRGPGGQVPGGVPGASISTVAGAPGENLSLAELLAGALAAYREI